LTHAHDENIGEPPRPYRQLSPKGKDAGGWINGQVLRANGGIV